MDRSECEHRSNCIRCNVLLPVRAALGTLLRELALGAVATVRARPVQGNGLAPLVLVGHLCSSSCLTGPLWHRESRGARRTGGLNLWSVRIPYTSDERCRRTSLVAARRRLSDLPALLPGLRRRRRRGPERDS